MSTSGLLFVPKEHWRHVIERLFTDEDKRNELWLRASSGEMPDLIALAKEIDKVEQGTSGYLEQLYAMTGPRTMHVFECGSLADHTAADLQAKLSTRANRALTVGQALVFRKTANPRKKPRLIELTLHAERLEVVVRLMKARSWRRDDETHSDWADCDVRLSVDLRPRKRIVEAYADIRDARHALIAFLEWLEKRELPERRNDEQRRYFDHAFFGETAVGVMTTKLGGGLFTQKADDPRKKQGKVQLWAPRADGADAYQDMDKTDPLLTGQAALGLPSDVTGVQFHVTHTDGFVELVQVTFGFEPRNPRISFIRKTSRHG
jgi:hypothetical protein